MLVMLVHTCLVEDAQHLVQPIVHLSVKTGYLYDDAVVCQTVDERVWQSFCHQTVVVVV